MSSRSHPLCKLHTWTALKKRETQHEYIVGTLLSSVIISSSSQSQFTLTCTTAKFSSWLFLFLTQKTEEIHTFSTEKHVRSQKAMWQSINTRNLEIYHLEFHSLSRGKEDEIKHKKSLDCAAGCCSVKLCDVILWKGRTIIVIHTQLKMFISTRKLEYISLLFTLLLEPFSSFRRRCSH